MVDAGMYETDSTDDIPNQIRFRNSVSSVPDNGNVNQKLQLSVTTPRGTTVAAGMLLRLTSGVGNTKSGIIGACDFCFTWCNFLWSSLVCLMFVCLFVFLFRAL